MVEKYGITDTGFRVKTLAEIRQSILDRLSTVKDPESGETLQLDLEENDPFVQMINSFADELSQCWLILNQTYDQFNPLLAAGPALSGLVQLNGIVRRYGSPSSVVLTFTGSPGVIVPLGTIVRDSEDKCRWATDAQVVIGNNGVASVNAYSVTNGAFDFAAGTINVIEEEIIGITAVINEAKTVSGAPDEDDDSLRVRRSVSTESPSRGMAESIIEAVSNLEGVEYARLFCNRSDTLDADTGIPSKTIALVIRGGDDTEIANELFLRSGLVTNYYGTTVVNYTDSLQQTVSVAFSRPAEVPIIVDIVTGDVEGSTKPVDYKTRIRENIIQFASKGPSGLGINKGAFDDFGFPPGENVSTYRLYVPVCAVPGCTAVDIKIGREEDGWDNMPLPTIIIAWNQVALFSAGNIRVDGTLPEDEENE